MVHLLQKKMQLSGIMFMEVLVALFSPMYLLLL